MPRSEAPGKARRRPRRGLKVLGALLILLLLWNAWLVISFRRYESALPSAPPPDAPPGSEVVGAYHVHTRFSDGRATVDGVARAAAAEGLAFVLLTDHGAPNAACLEAEGPRRGVAIISGSEISSSRGHLVALGFRRPEAGFSRDADLAVGEVAALGGFTVVAHPFSKTRWSWGGPASFDGLEIMDADTMILRHWARTLPALPALLVRPEAALLRIVDPPVQSLARWDRLLAQRPVLGFLSADAHFLYHAAFRMFLVHAVLEAPPAADFAAARGQILAALREGRFYGAVDAAASSRGFRVWVSDGRLRVWAPFSFRHETRIIRGGKTVHVSPETSVTYPLTDGGPLRVEVYLREPSPLDPAVPWIVANPVRAASRPPRP